MAITQSISRLLFGISSIIIACSVVSFAKSYRAAQLHLSDRSFSVSADAKIIAIPDTAAFQFSVITEGGQDINSLMLQNTDKINNALNFLKTNGIADNDIKTLNYNLSPRYQTYNCTPIPPVTANQPQPAPCPPAQIVGYNITQDVQVKIHDFKLIGPILSGIINKGANQVSALNFTVDDPSTLQTKALNEAIAKAKLKAQNLANSAGIKLGSLININENADNNSNYRMMNMAVGMATPPAAPMPAPNIAAGSEIITANVTLQYAIN